MRQLFLSIALLPLGAAAAFCQAEPTALPTANTPVPTVIEEPDLVHTYQETITADDLAAHLYFFASDFFEGRRTASTGQRLAAHYLASQYRKLGLDPKGTVQTNRPEDPARFLQHVPLKSSSFASAQLAISADGRPAGEYDFPPSDGDGAFYVRIGNEGTTSGGVVFGGYGISDEELGYDDLAALEADGIETAGKWLLILRDEPLKTADESLLPTADGKPSQWTSRWYSKLFAARRAEVAGVLVVADVGPAAPSSFAAEVKRVFASNQESASLSLGEDSESSWRSSPVLYVSSAWADRLLAPTGQTVAEIKARIDETLKPVVFEIPGAQATADIRFKEEDTSSENVVAMLEGSDPELKHEFVVISSHYDHVGVDRAREGDQVFNGADDDGSGTVSILEIAEAFVAAAHDGYRPRRSIIFLNVTGEEEGLLGSSWFTDYEPMVPLDRIVTNLNMDMVGRYDPSHPTGSTNYVYIIGSHLISQELHEINERVNELTGVDLELDERYNSADDPNQFYRRSDHWNFGKHQIPFIFFFTGTHEDYHGVDDEPDKIAYDRMARIARLVFATAWQIANQDAPPAVSGAGFN